MSTPRRLSALRRASAFPRTEDHLLRQSQSGALITVLGALCLLILLTAELRDFLKVTHTKKLGVDTRRGQAGLPMLFHITFPAVPCAVLTMDSVDIAGTQDAGSLASLVKTRLDVGGHALGVYESPVVENDFLKLFGSIAQARA
jgi:hypothetical protein